MMRVTFTTLRSGQPRPYADTQRILQLRCEHISWNKSDYEPYLIDEEVARRLAEAFGPLPPKRLDAGPFMSYLDYFRPTDPKRFDRFGREDPDAPVRASVWEYRIVEPFTD